MTKKTIWVVLITFLALVLRVYLATEGPFDYDEGPYFKAAVQYNIAIRTGNWDQILNSTNNTEHPQFNKLIYAVGLLPARPVNNIVTMWAGDQLKSIAYWPKILGLRLISVFFGTATVLVVSMINPIAGLFLAVDTFEIKYTSVIYLEALPQLMCLLSMLAALKALDTYQAGGSGLQRWFKWFFLSALAMGMAVASKYLYGTLMIAIGIALLWRGWKQRGAVLLGLAGWGILCAAFFVLFDPILWNGVVARLSDSFQFSLDYQNNSYVALVGYPVWQPIMWLMLSIPQHPVFPEAFMMNHADYFVLADSLIFFLALLGLPMLFKKNKPAFWCLLVGIVFLLVWKTKWPQYMMLVIPALCLSAGHGFELLRPYLPGGEKSLVDRLSQVKFKKDSDLH